MRPLFLDPRYFREAENGETNCLLRLRFLSCSVCLSPRVPPLSGIDYSIRVRAICFSVPPPPLTPHDGSRRGHSPLFFSRQLAVTSRR